MTKRQSMRGMGADAFFNAPRPADSNGATEPATSKPASQQAGAQATAAELVKATFYLTPDHVMKLEQVRLSRRRQGEKVDKSALVREAIDALAE